MLDATPSVIRKVKNLGFPCPYQLYLVERNCTFYWLGNGGMGTTLSTEVSPEEADTIIRLINSKILIRTAQEVRITPSKIGHYILLQSDVTTETELLPEHKTPGNKDCFLKKVALRKLKHADFLGLVKIENNPDVTTPYAWHYRGGMGNAMFTNVDTLDIVAIEALLEDNTFRFDESYTLGETVEVTPIIT